MKTIKSENVYSENICDQIFLFNKNIENYFSLILQYIMLVYLKN